MARRAAGLATALAAALAATAAPAAGSAAGIASAAAPLPTERQTVARLDADATHRIYLADPVIGHLIDGRLHVIDGRSMRYLSAMSTGYVGQTALSPDRRELYVATTYYTRLHRGTRTDVVDVYGTDDLALRHEIEIPPKHAQSLNIRATLAPSADGRWLLVQNATPASSVTVVDLQGRKTASEVPTPGCWGVLPWPKDASRFSTVCGDGTLATVELDETGQARPRTPGVKFFDPDSDPVFMHYEVVGDTLWFVSYGGKLHGVRLDAAGVQPEAPWSFVPAADARAGWRPGGYQLFAVDAARQRLFVGMHPGAKDGSHKSPAQQLWVIDLAQKKRVARWPGQNAVSMTMSVPGAANASGAAAGAPPRLFVLDGLTNGLVSLDPRAAGVPKPIARFDGLGETPVYLEAQ